LQGGVEHYVGKQFGTPYLTLPYHPEHRGRDVADTPRNIQLGFARSRSQAGTGGGVDEAAAAAAAAATLEPGAERGGHLHMNAASWIASARSASSIAFAASPLAADNTVCVHSAGCHLKHAMFATGSPPAEPGFDRVAMPAPVPVPLTEVELDLGTAATWPTGRHATPWLPYQPWLAREYAFRPSPHICCMSLCSHTRAPMTLHVWRAWCMLPVPICL